MAEFRLAGMKKTPPLRDVRVFITGAGGFIGSHLVRALLAEGAEIFATSLEEAPWRLRGVSRRIAFRSISVTSEHALASALKSFEPAVVFHLAALVPARALASARSAEVIEGGTRVLAGSLARIGSFAKLVTLGSADEYGKARSLRETSRARALTPYGISKRRATEYLRRTAGAPFSAVVLRPPIVYGPAQDFGMFVPSCIRACLRREPFAVRGEKIARDFLYVSDLVDAMLLAAVCDSPRFTVVNVGSGRATPLSVAARIIAKRLRAETLIRLEPEARSAYEPETRRLIIDKARRELSWFPKVALAEGLFATIRWYEEHRELFSRLGAHN